MSPWKFAWQYLSQAQKTSFKQQARDLLRRLSSIKPSNSNRSYIAPDPDPVAHRGIKDIEHQIIFSADSPDQDIAFMHNDLSRSNIIVDSDKIVGLIDWEMAGYFGWKTAGEIRARIRSPKREDYAGLDYLKDDFFSDLLFWNDLYLVNSTP